MKTLRRHPILAGAVLGLTWGVVMRVWMRFIATNPEFTWSGTGFILGATTLAGTLMGVAWWRSQVSRRNWWRFTAFGLLPLGMAAGGVMLPSAILAGLAIGRRTWNRWIRSALLVAAVAFQVIFFVGQTEGLGAKTVPAYAWYAVMLGLESWAASIPFRSRQVPDPEAVSSTEASAPRLVDAVD